MEKRSTQLLRSWKRLAAELVVVFLGVYGAFWVENYRDQQDQIDRTEQVILALQQDLRDYVEVTDAFNKHVEDGLRDWAGARESGEAPAPFVFRIYGAETPPLSTWEVVRQAGLAELLQANLLYELGFFYNEIAGMGARYIRYAEFTESEVLPLAKIGSASFYSADGKLLPRFAAHMDRLRELGNFMGESVEWASCILERLESADERTATCRRDVGVTPM